MDIEGECQSSESSSSHLRVFLRLCPLEQCSVPGSGGNLKLCDDIYQCLVGQSWPSHLISCFITYSSVSSPIFLPIIPFLPSKSKMKKLSCFTVLQKTTPKKYLRWLLERKESIMSHLESFAPWLLSGLPQSHIWYALPLQQELLTLVLEPLTGPWMGFHIWGWMPTKQKT